MPEIKNKKYYSIQITERFFIAMDSIVGNKSAGKITAGKFGETVGIHSSNLNRIRKNIQENHVTIEAIGRLCNQYKISAGWLLTGNGSLYNTDDSAQAYRALENRIKELEKKLPKKLPKRNKNN